LHNKGLREYYCLTTRYYINGRQMKKDAMDWIYNLNRRREQWEKSCSHKFS